MEQIAIDDISDLLYSISIKYNLDLDLLRDRYPTIHIEKKIRFKRINKNKNKNKIKKIKLIVNLKYNKIIINSITPNQTEQHLRCNAGIWARRFCSF